MQTTKHDYGRKGQKGSRSKWDIVFQRYIAQEYINGDQSLNQMAKKFNVPNQTINRWVLRYSSELSESISIPQMTEQEQRDLAALQKQVAALKRKLEYEQMKNFALEAMIDLAKTELGVDVRKNSGAKQPKE